MPDLIGVNGDRAAEILRDARLSRRGRRLDAVSGRRRRRRPAAEPAGRLSDRARASRSRSRSAGERADRAVDPRRPTSPRSATRRGGRARRRRSDSRRRDGRPLRAEHHHRAAGRPRRSSGSRTVPLDVHLMITDPDRYIDAFARGRRVDDLGPRRSAAAPAPHRARHQGARRQGGRRAQPVDAGRRARADRRRRRLRAGDVGQPRLRRPDFHPAQRVESAGGPRAARSRRQSARRSKSTAASTSQQRGRVVAAGARILVAGIGDLPGTPRSRARDARAQGRRAAAARSLDERGSAGAR